MPPLRHVAGLVAGLSLVASAAFARSKHDDPLLINCAEEKLLFCVFNGGDNVAEVAAWGKVLEHGERGSPNCKGQGKGHCKLAVLAFGRTCDKSKSFGKVDFKEAYRIFDKSSQDDWLQKVEDGDESCGEVSLRSHGGRFIGLHKAGGDYDGTVKADRERTGVETRWVIKTTKDGTGIYLRGDEGRALTAENDGRIQVENKLMIANALWTVVDQGNGKVALRSSHGKFLSVRDDGSVAADKDTAGDAEQFAEVEQ